MSRPSDMRKILDIIDTVEGRCLAADGPVTPTLREISDDEVRRLDRYAQGTPAQAVMDHVRTRGVPPGGWLDDALSVAGLVLPRRISGPCTGPLGGKHA